MVPGTGNYSDWDRICPLAFIPAVTLGSVPVLGWLMVTSGLFEGAYAFRVRGSTQSEPWRWLLKAKAVLHLVVPGWCGPLVRPADTSHFRSWGDAVPPKQIAPPYSALKRRTTRACGYNNSKRALVLRKKRFARPFVFFAIAPFCLQIRHAVRLTGKFEISKNLAGSLPAEHSLASSGEVYELLKCRAAENGEAEVTKVADDSRNGTIGIPGAGTGIRGRPFTGL